MKQCKSCGDIKDFSLFTRAKLAKDGYKNTCKACVAKQKSERYHKNKKEGLYNPEINKHHLLKKMYGISLEDYNIMLESQGFCCAICGSHSDNFKRSLAVDHDHATGNVRGLLCHYCNTAIGLLKENVTTLKDAIRYLETYIHKE